MLATNIADLDDNEGSLGFIGHLYSKATHKFDEGCTNGLLMQNTLTSKDGRRYLLHNHSRHHSENRIEKITGDGLTSLYGIFLFLKSNHHYRLDLFHWFFGEMCHGVSWINLMC